MKSRKAKTIRIAANQTPRSRGVHEEDLSAMEEFMDRSFFREIGIKAATNAVNENKAMGIPVTFLQDDWVVRRMPEGNIEKVTRVSGSDRIKYRQLKKGTVLHVKRTAH
ncbi:hypothetical protein [Chitinophaga sp. XS-30]|uniref:hypothetical protein n=1 Tax=Chitinophaga sp. XS-30 TaxID=2604421 RepID=UPI0011DDE169|nr:hypothetical protein [Chitinophaga sp. XS-30]QEH40683.1 hypothetical protein FW415_07265 [Chitinophaga sp. XS-30]